ncbi:Tetratricopeptide repeat protein 15-like [Mycena kentingensis (nom. inval.)]|nr:Tetratricopeptide repeat protein 15-like [Mycena kentingensis (nom. inval.)]
MSEPHTPDLSNDAGSSVFDESSTSQVYVEPEVPDPFLIDDDASDDDAGVTPTVAESRHSLAATQEVELAPLEASLSPNPLSPSILQSPNRDKDVPPPPSDSDTDEEEEPELYLPALVVPTMFLPLPNTDPLTTLLTKYIHPPENRPSRDLAGEWQHTDFHTLVMSNSWRALARMARDRIVTSDPEDLALVLGLWYLRLSSLARLRLFNQTTAECNNLFNLLNSIEPLATRQWLFDRVLPFELEVMNARLKYWAGDHMGYLDALHALLRKCKSRSRRARDDASVVAMWKERGARVCLIIASQLVEMKDYTAATTLLTPLCTQPAEVEDSESSEDSGSSPSLINSPALHSAIARIYLQCGNLAMAMHHFGAVAAADSGATEGMREMNAALMAGAEGDWVQVTEILQGKVFDAEGPERLVAVNNLCVALLNQGKLKEGIAAMERVLKESPESVVVAEPYLFNLSTLYELRSATAIENKRKLLVDVARWSGDGLKTTCLKMPT